MSKALSIDGDHCSKSHEKWTFSLIHEFAIDFELVPSCMNRITLYKATHEVFQMLIESETSINEFTVFQMLLARLAIVWPWKTEIKDNQHKVGPIEMAKLY